MPSHTVKQIKLTSIELADRTLELDMSALQTDRTNTRFDSRPSTRQPAKNDQDATVVLDLTATQIHEMLEGDE